MSRSYSTKATPSPDALPAPENVPQITLPAPAELYPR